MLENCKVVALPAQGVKLDAVAATEVRGVQQPETVSVTLAVELQPFELVTE